MEVNQTHSQEILAQNRVNEEGRLRTVMAIGLAASAALIAWSPLDTMAGRLLGSLMPNTKVTGGEIVGKQIFSGPIELDCKVLALFDVSDSSVEFHARLGNKQVPGAYQILNYKDPAEKKAEQSVVQLETCENKALANDPPKSIKIEEGFAKSKDTFNETFITIDTSTIVTDAQFVEGQKVVNEVNGAIWGGGSGTTKVGSAIANGLCQGITLGKLGKNCDDISAKLSAIAVRAEDKNRMTADVMVLRAIQKEGSELAWEKVTKKTLIDAYACEAKRKGGQEALDQLRIKVVGGTPKFGVDVLDPYRGNLLDEKDENLVVADDKTKITIKPLDGYDFKCATALTVDKDGWTRVH